MTKLQKETIKDWLSSAKDDRATAYDMFKLRRYGWSLFIFNLAIEKLLKSQLVKQNKAVIFTHDLEKLAKLAEIILSAKQRGELKEISTYNIKARYDIEKMKFYKKANLEYTKHWIKICEEMYNWLKELL